MNRLRSFLNLRAILAALGVVVVLALGIVLGPMLLSGPQVVTISPNDSSSDANPQAAIRIEFNQWVRPASVAAALQLDPPVAFQLVESGGPFTRVVTLQPEGGLRYGTRYQLTLGNGVQNLLGRTMEQPLTLAFSTVPYVTVAQFGPAQGSSDVDLNAPLTVEFAVPVVSAETIGAAAEDPRLAESMPQPLSLEPAQQGTGRWLTPTLFSFAPTGGFHAAITYTATVRADISADGQARMQQPVSWSFSTARPLLVGARPYDGARDVPVDSPVEVRLAADVDINSASQNFTLVDSRGQAVNGSVEQSENGFFFKPAEPLRRSDQYQATLAAGIRTSMGAMLNTQSLSWNFTVIGDLEVAEVVPAPDATDVPTLTNQLLVHFNHPVVAVTQPSDNNALPVPISITPAPQGKGYWLDTSTYAYSLTAPLAPSTSYRVQVAAGLRDQTGGELRQEYAWTFSTITPQIVATLPDYNAPFVNPNGPIQIIFNQPMDAASLQSGIRLERSDGVNVPGQVQTAEHIATFTPSAPLERGASYRLRVAQGVRSAQGNGSLASGTVLEFRVAPVARFSGSEPGDGSTSADTNTGIKLVFSAPMDWASVEQNLVVEPKPTQIYTGTTENEFYLYFALKPESDYRITVGAAARDAFGVALDQAVSISFRTAALPPSFSFVGAYQLGAYNAYVPTRVPIRHVNTANLNYSLHRVEVTQVAQLLGNYDAWQTFQPSANTLVTEGGQDLAGERNSEQITFLDLGKLDAGTYYLAVRGPNNAFDRQILVVSPYALTIKRSADSVFVWAVDLANGQPVSDLALTAGSFIYAPQTSGPPQGDLRTQDLGRTASDGVLEASFNTANPYDSIFFWTPAGDRFAFATTTWGEGINPWDFGLPADYLQNPLVGNISTDRPIYRPDQSVYIKGVLRLTQNERYTLPGPDQQALLTITDPQNNTVFSGTLALSDFGSFNTQFTLDRSAAVGTYSMAARLASDIPEHSVFGTFTVAEYRKPVFDVAVEPQQPDLLQGDPLEMTVTAKYFAGGVLANAPVRWRLLAGPFYFSSNTAPNYRFEDLDDPAVWYRWFESARPGGGGELIAEGTATTDSQGRFSLSLPAETYRAGNVPTSSRRLTLDVEITDIDGQVIAAQGSTTAHAGAFYIGLRPAGYVAQVGQAQQVDLITLDPQDRPVADRDLDVSIYRREWYSVREQGSDGRLYWTSNYTDTLVDTTSARTDAQGRASINFTPPSGGSYRITAEGRDAAGRNIKASAFTWAYGGDVFWGLDDTNRIDLIADKDSYKPGDTAQVLVAAPYSGMTALMTLERGGVIEHRQFTIQGTSELLSVPITADYAPNVYVSVVLIKPAGGDLPVPDMRVGLVNLAVSTEQQALNISISPDKEQVGPRDQVTYAIKATDYTGKGVRTELSLALVDEAIFSLADDPNPTLTQAFYTRRPLGVFTAQSLTALVDRVTLRLQPGSKGGGGGAGSDVLLRRDFPDTAYWNPTLLTADDGTASVTVTLPDSLTTWRMTARGLTADTLVGQASQEIIATRPLLLRPSLPRFLTVGDKLNLRAVVQNSTNAAIDATATIGLEGDAQIALSSDAEQRVQVDANGQVLVSWQAEVTRAGTAIVRFTVSGGGLGDAIEQRLPVQRFVTPVTSASAGQVFDTTIETVQVPASGGQPQGELDLELVPSLAAGVSSGLDYLATYPYGCTEQTVSRFLPNAVTYRLFKQLGLDDAKLKSGLDQNLAAALQRLYALQHLDGGWGWWADDASQPFISAYVVQGLTEARKAGYGIDEQVFDRAINYLKTALDTQPQSDATVDDQLAITNPNTRAYVLFVLAEAGQPDRGRTVTLYDVRAQLDVYGRAYLLMTLKTLGDDARVQPLVSDLLSRAIVRPTDAHWAERKPDYLTMNSDTRSTALALQALVRSDPNNFLVPNAVRYLMSLRDQSHWRSTQESAFTLMALSEYIAQSGELLGDYSYRAALDGTTLSEGRIDSTNLDDPISVVFDLAQLTAGGNRQVSIQRQAAAGQSGKGKLYYTLRLRSYQDAAAVQPLDAGIGLRREYIAVDTATLTPTGQLINSVKQGDVVQVRLTITVPADVYYLTVEDMLPAGLEPLDTSLKTTSAAAQDPTLSDANAERPGWWYFGQTAIRDNRVALFATSLAKGTYTYTYLARAVTPGSFQTLPATAYQMYAPEVFGRSGGANFTVTE